jgi:hypothetical protein
MKITSFSEFKELAGRGTFVPVCKEIMADLLTPVSAFMKIAEHADYAFLLESVEGGEHVGRYSFLGKDPFLILRARDGTTTIERGSSTEESDRPFVDTLRGLMAGFQSPYVADLPRFTGGAVGYFGYGAASWFEPVLGDLGQGSDGSDQAGFMVFDTILAFDHVQHRILIIANARVTADDDLESLYGFACAKIQFLERELDRGLSRSRRGPATPLDVRSNHTQEEFEAQVRSAFRSSCLSASRLTSRSIPSPCIARSVTSIRPRTCIFFAWAACPWWGRLQRCWSGSRVRASKRTPLPAPGPVAGRVRKTFGLARSSRATRRSAPSTSCWSTLAGTTSAACARTGPYGSRSSWGSIVFPTSCT